jgi:hypothetical protein
MRITPRIITAFLAAAALVLAGAGAADAAPRPSDGAAGQCERPLSERTGNWFCPEPAAAVRAVGSADPTGYCNVSGCYRRYNDFRADFRSAPGAWGYGPTKLGEQQHEVVWQIVGARMTARPVYYENSVGTVAVQFSGNLLNAAPGRLGDPVGDAYGVHNVGSVPPGFRQAWRPRGYTAIDRNNFDHVLVVQFAWSHPEYPGHWYSWVKSPNATSTDKAIYRFRGVEQLPAEPYGGGYQP